MQERTDKNAKIPAAGRPMILVILDGWGYSEETKDMLMTSHGFVPWDDAHHPELSMTDGVPDGRWIFINGNNTPRVARIDLTEGPTEIRRIGQKRAAGGSCRHIFMVVDNIGHSGHLIWLVGGFNLDIDPCGFGYD